MHVLDAVCSGKLIAMVACDDSGDATNFRMDHPLSVSGLRLPRFEWPHSAAGAEFPKSRVTSNSRKDDIE